MRPARIVIFAKEPVPGRVKTRLIPALGAHGAAKLASDMLARTVEEAVAARVGEPELCGDPDPVGWYQGPPIHRTSQGDGDLGQRLARAVRRILGEGENPILIGADCPDLDRHRLKSAAEALAAHDTVIHPALDGGYVLLGLRRFDRSLFHGIAWSTAAVGGETMERIRLLGWSLDVRETLGDVDEPGDLALVGRP